MIVLGLDTSSYTDVIGLVDGEKVLANALYAARTDSLEKIVARVKDVLVNAGLTLADVDGIGVGLGPGSWTGIRVGVTVAKTLALATSRPLAGVPTLEILAWQAREIAVKACAIVAVGAGDAVYAAFYRFNDGGMTIEGDYYVGGLPGLAALLSEPVAIVGEGAVGYAETLAGFLKSPVKLEAMETQPTGAVVAGLAARRLAAGGSDDPLSLAPLYLKDSTARAFVNKYAPGGLER